MGRFNPPDSGWTWKVFYLFIYSLSYKDLNPKSLYYILTATRIWILFAMHHFTIWVEPPQIGCELGFKKWLLKFMFYVLKSKCWFMKLLLLKKNVNSMKHLSKTDIENCFWKTISEKQLSKRYMFSINMQKSKRVEMAVPFIFSGNVPKPGLHLHKKYNFRKSYRQHKGEKNIQLLNQYSIHILQLYITNGHYRFYSLKPAKSATSLLVALAFSFPSIRIRRGR